MGEMTSFERVTAAANDEPVDRIPVSAIAGGMNRRLLGDASFPKYAKSVEMQARGNIEVVKRYDLDLLVPLTYMHRTAEDLGAEIEFKKKHPPMHIPPESWSPEDYEEKIELPDGIGPSVQCRVDYLEKIVEGIPDTPVFAFLSGPFTTLGQRVGVEQVLRDLYQNPDAVKGALEKTREYVVRAIDAFGKIEGLAGVCLDELHGNEGIMSPEMYREFGAAYIDEVIDAMDRNDLLFTQHNCGESAMLDIQIKEWEPVAYSHAYYEKRGKVPDVEGIIEEYGHHTLLVGNIDPQLYQSSTPGEMKKHARDLLERVLRSLKENDHVSKYVICSGCEVPPTYGSFDNVGATVEAVKEYGPKLQEEIIGETA